MTKNIHGMTALATAIETDHPCTDRGCDIATALRHGFVIASAILLTGATEAPETSAVIARYGLDLGTVHDSGFTRWAAWHRAHGTACPACDSYAYQWDEDDSSPEVCSNCLAMLTQSST